MLDEIDLEELAEWGAFYAILHSAPSETPAGIATAEELAARATASVQNFISGRRRR